MERHKYIEHIGEQCQIERKDGKHFKRITYLTNETQRGATVDSSCGDEDHDALCEEDYVRCRKLNCV